MCLKHRIDLHLLLVEILAFSHNVLVILIIPGIQEGLFPFTAGFKILLAAAEQKKLTHTFRERHLLLCRIFGYELFKDILYSFQHPCVTFGKHVTLHEPGLQEFFFYRRFHVKIELLFIYLFLGYNRLVKKGSQIRYALFDLFLPLEVRKEYVYEVGKPLHVFAVLAVGILCFICFLEPVPQPLGIA